MRGLQVHAVSWRYGRKAVLDDVSLEVFPGSFCALPGPNGAGKTALFSIATRLFHARQGRAPDAAAGAGGPARGEGAHAERRPPRRLEIARSLVHRPSVLLLDEPTVGLDVALRRAIVDIDDLRVCGSDEGQRGAEGGQCDREGIQQVAHVSVP